MPCALGLVAMVFACAGAKPPFRFQGPEPVNASDRAMARLAERYLDASLKLSPLTASYVGYRKYDHLLPDYSRDGLVRSVNVLRAYESELRKIDRAKLSTAWAIDHELIGDRIAAELFSLTELKPHEWDVQLYNEAVGGAFYYLTIPPEDPARWPDRLEAVLARMEALPRFLEQAKANLKTPPKVFTEFVIAQNKGNVATFEESLPRLFEPYPALNARFVALRPAAVKAVQDFQAFLEGELLARSTGDWRLGRLKWERKLRLTLQSDATSEEIGQAAEAALDATRFEMYDVALPLYRAMFPGDRTYLALSGDARINHVVGRVIAEASQEHGTPASIFEDVKRHTAKIKGFIKAADLIGLPPETDNFVLEPTPPFLDGLAVAFYNPAPAFEPDLKKSYWISSVPKPGTEDAESYLREYNDHILQALTIHEAFPGHYVQLYWSSHSPTASITKQVLESGTMAEGWACMIEQLMHEAGYSKDDPKSYLFHLKMRLRVFINAIIDERLHTSTGDEAALDPWALDLMMTKGFQEKAEATRKLRRAKLTAAQLSTYFVGYREMLDLYRRGQERGAKDFVPRPFLEKMIGYGTIPPRIIARLLAAEGLL
jgi:uncharacterized protein (DUF885 family)